MGTRRKLPSYCIWLVLLKAFIFLDQDDITLAHIDSDGIHLNFNGTSILKYNILKVFHTFNCNYMNFNNDYNNALC